MTGGAGGARGRRDAAACATLVAFWLVPIAVVGTHGDFPLNDDWAFARTAWDWLDSGRFERIPWVYSTAIPNVAFGAALSWMFGQSYEVLRWGNLCIGLGGSLAAYGLCRSVGAAPALALLGAAVLALNPIHQNLSFTFMSDIPFAALCSGALAFAVYALRGGSRGALAAAVGLAVLAVLARQPGVALGIAALAAGCLAGGNSRKRWLVVSAVLAVAGAVWMVFALLLAPDDDPRAPYTLLRYVRDYVLDGDLLYKLLTSGAVACAYLGLFLSPLLVAVSPSSDFGRRLEIAAGIAAALALAILAMLGMRMPFGVNVLQEFGVGPTELDGAGERAAVAAAPWWGVTAIAVWGAWALAARLAASLWERRHRIAQEPGWVLLITFVVIYVGSLLVRRPFFDRYLLAVIPALAALILWQPVGATAGWRPVRWRAVLGVALCFGLGVMGLLGTRDYLEHHRARWALLRPLLENGIEPKRIDGGFEFGGRYIFHPKWAWSVDNEYLLSFRSEVPGYTRIASREVERWWPPRLETLSIHHRVGDAPEGDRVGDRVGGR